MLFKKKENKDIITDIYSHDIVKRTLIFIVGVFITALGFNVFMLPNDIVYGVSGIGVIFKKIFEFDVSMTILVSSLILLILSLVSLGPKKTAKSVVGTLLYPVFVKLTEPIVPYVDFGQTEHFLIAICGAAVTGLGLGLIFKSGYNTGGTDILNEIVSKYFKMSIGNAMFFTDGIIIVCSLFLFGWQKFLYSVVNIVIVSIIADKVILGISNSKTFYIITEKDEEVKKFIMENLEKGITVINSRGGYTNNAEKMIMCTLPTREYFLLKEGIQEIDKNAFFLVTDAYEVYGGSLR
jgi:uncharacterized membrane-anchored protein YitT (DUF2179 family)